MSTVDSNLLPHRLRESGFRRFEQTIRNIVDEYPNVVTISAGDLSPLTVVARLRDAMLSLHRYRWATDVDMVAFEATYNAIIVSHRGSSILAGGRDQIKQFDPLRVVGSDVSPALGKIADASEVFELGFDEVKLVCLLASKGLLRNPISFVSKILPGVDEGVGDADIVALEDSFDIRVDKLKDGVYTIS